MSCVTVGRFKAGSNADLERTIAEAYVDEGRVVRKTTMVLGHTVEYLEAGDAAARPVVFCHGAAFSAHTWQIMGALDAVAKAGFRALALNLPGYGASEKTIGSADGKTGFLASFADALNLRSVFVVAASMGGSYAFPFVLSRHVAGFVTAAAVYPSTDFRGLPPTLAIYGELLGKR